MEGSAGLSKLIGLTAMGSLVPAAFSQGARLGKAQRVAVARALPNAHL